MPPDYPEGEKLFVELREDNSLCVTAGDPGRDKMAKTVTRRFEISPEQAALSLDEIRPRIDAHEILEIQPPPPAPKRDEKLNNDWQFALEEGRQRGVNGIRRHLAANGALDQMSPKTREVEENQ